MVIGGTVTDDSTNEWLALDQKVLLSFIMVLFCFEFHFMAWLLVFSFQLASCSYIHLVTISTFCVFFCHNTCVVCYKIQCAAQVNSYPTVRGFTAIGTGGEDFVQAMVVAVESVIQQPIPQVYFIFYIFVKTFLENWRLDLFVGKKIAH